MFRLLALLLVSAWAQTNDVSDADVQLVLDQAADSVNKFCAQTLEPLNYEEERQSLEVGAGEDNFIYTAVTEAGIAVQQGQSAKELSATLQEVADPGFIIGKAFAVILSLVLLVGWIACCWFVCCPCCMRMCCKCCQKKRTVGETRLCQALLWLIFIGLGIAAIVLVSLSLRGESRIDAGFAGTFCSAANLVKDSVSGTDSFIGLLPAISELESISQVLNPGSTFMTNIQGIVASTSSIELAFTQVTKTLQQLEELMADSENQAPTGSMHECMICSDISNMLTPVRTTLDNSFGTSLRATRREVEERLQGDAAADLRAQLQSAMEPVRAAKNQLVSQVGELVDPQGLQKEAEWVYGEGSQLRPAILLLFMIYLVVVICGFLALGGFCYSHKPSNGNQDHTCVRFCTCCSMCGACFYAMSVLLIGGIMVIIAMVGSGTCLVLIDFNADMGESLFAALGQDVTPDVQMAINIADRCLSINSVAGAGASTNLADIVTMGNVSDPSQTVSIRESVFDMAVNPIESQFQGVLSSMGGTIPALQTTTEFQDLVTLIGALEMPALYWPIVSEVDASSTYQDINPTYKYIGLACADTTLSASLPSPLGGSTVVGMDSMLSGFTSNGNAVPGLGSQMTGGTYSWTCPSLTGYTCDAAQDPSCSAGANFMVNIKEPLVTQNKFNCKYMKQPGTTNTICRPGDMVKDGSGTWSGACVNAADGTVEFIERTCTLAEFQANVVQIASDLNKGLEYVDDTVLQVMGSIGTDLINEVNNAFIAPLETLLNSFDCTFMKDFWQGLTDSMCYRGMNGFRMVSNSYVAVAVLSLCIALLLYIPWRLSRDNYDRGLLEGDGEVVQSQTV